MKKKKNKTKLKWIIIILLIIIISILLFIGYRNIKVKNIYVIGNDILKEYEIIDETSLKEYPYLYTVSTSKIEQILKENPLIDDVKVSKTIFGKVTIKISENKVLYQDKDSEYVLSNNSHIILDNHLFGIPILINDCLDVCPKLTQKLLLVDKDILMRISEIEYQPTELDKERFMFYMNDGNYVYVTLSKVSLINSYNEIYPTLEGKKGILYLDSGNHFEIKK